MSEENATTLIIKAMEVEQAAYDEFKGDGQDYRAKLRSLFQNLKNVSNPELGPRVLSGEIPAKRFVVMSHDELKSAQRRAEDQKLEADNLKKAQVPMAEKSISDALRCGRCGQKKVSYSQAQTRSADEPMTTFCECTVCGNRWKVCLSESSLHGISLNNYSSLELWTRRNPKTNFHFSCAFMDGFRGWGLSDTAVFLGDAKVREVSSKFVVCI